MGTEQEIREQGGHLMEIHSVLCASVLCLLSLVPEVKAHVSDEAGDAIVRFASETMKPIAEAVVDQVDALAEAFRVAHAEVDQLEQLLQVEEAGE